MGLLNEIARNFTMEKFGKSLIKLEKSLIKKRDLKLQERNKNLQLSTCMYFD
jgi:hypothetical protein